jgi:hypothetical protein
MTTIVTRAVKGSPLSWSEADANFVNLSDTIDTNYTTLNTNKLEVTTAASTYETQSHASSTYAPISTTVTKDSDTGAVNTTNGTTAERPTNAVAKVRYNSTLDAYEGYTTFYGWDGLHNGPKLKLGRHATSTNNLIITGGTSGDPCVITDGAAGAIAILRPNLNEFTGNVRVSGIGTNVYPLVSSSTQTSNSGTVVVFSIPSWATTITMHLAGVSSTSTGNYQVQVGLSGTYTTSGYVGSIMHSSSGGNALSALSTGFNITHTSTAANLHSGIVTLKRLVSSQWSATSSLGNDTGGAIETMAGYVTHGDLTEIKLLVLSGTFDAGYVSVSYQ